MNAEKTKLTVAYLGRYSDLHYAAYAQIMPVLCNNNKDGGVVFRLCNTGWIVYYSIAGSSVCVINIEVEVTCVNCYPNLQVLL